LWTVLEESADRVFLKDRDGRYRMINAAGAALLDKPVEEVLDRTDAELMDDGPVLERWQALHQRVLAEGRAVSSDETLTIRGRRYEFLETLIPHRDARGTIIGVIGVARDTTEFRAALRRLEQSERLVSVGTLAAGVAHEINNPVGCMLLGAQAALEELDERGDPAFVKRCLTEIADDARRCGRIVQSVLRFSRREETEKWLNNINALVDRARYLTRESVARADCSIELDLAANLPEVSLNPTEFEQVMINLIENAVASGGAGTQVRVTTSADEGGVRVSVADNGPGIAADDAQYIFDPFYTTRPQQGGTGLGLSVVHGIVQAHNGTIRLESEPGVGSTFTIELPCPQSGSGQRYDEGR
jgi:two-component system NtrC family sensor kinase